jgi:hypothetical protein
MAYIAARGDAPKHRRGNLPPESLEPGVDRIQQWVERRNQLIAAMVTHYRHSSPSKIIQAETELVRPQRELKKQQAGLDLATERYRTDHDGLEPPEHGVQFSQLASFWLFGIIFSIGELPIMSAALERLPLPDWMRFIAAIGASAVVIYLSHEIGIWFAKPYKTLLQSVAGWLMLAALFAILTFAALVRRDSLLNNQKSPANSAPEVYIHQMHGGKESNV